MEVPCTLAATFNNPPLRARSRIDSHSGASAGRADARRRDAGDISVYRRGAATKQMPARRRAPSGCGPQARWLCCSLLTYHPGYSSSLAPRQRAWGPAAKCQVILARALRCRFIESCLFQCSNGFLNALRKRLHIFRRRRCGDESAEITFPEATQGFLNDSIRYRLF